MELVYVIVLGSGLCWATFKLIDIVCTELDRDRETRRKLEQECKKEMEMIDTIFGPAVRYYSDRGLLGSGCPILLEPKHVSTNKAIRRLK